MGFRANFTEDLPGALALPTEIIFYAAGLKIYGLLPYLLNRRVRGAFISNAYAGPSMTMETPTGERNYTLVPYNQSDAAASALLDWFYAERGFRWALAAPGHFERGDLHQINWGNLPPLVWHPADGTRRAGFSTVLRGQRPTATTLEMLLGPPDGAVS